MTSDQQPLLVIRTFWSQTGCGNVAHYKGLGPHTTQSPSDVLYRCPLRYVYILVGRRITSPLVLSLNLISLENLHLMDGGLEVLEEK